MTKPILLASLVGAALLAGCAADASEETESSDDAINQHPDRNVTYKAPIAPEAPVEEDLTKLNATDLRGFTGVINIKPVFDVPKPPTEAKHSPPVR